MKEGNILVKINKIGQDLRNYIQKNVKGLMMNPHETQSSNLIDEALLYSGIKKNDLEKYKNLSLVPEKFHDIGDTRNIELSENIWNAVKNNKNVFVLVDPDADGYSSSALLINYFKKVFPSNPIKFLMSPTKKHGIRANKAVLENPVFNIDKIDFLVLPDSSSNDYSYLSSCDFDYLVIDHHNISDAVPLEMPIISSQLDDTNKELTGVGMVYIVLKYLDYIHKIDVVPSMIDLVMIGEIGDMADVSDPEIRLLINKAFDSVKNKLLRTYFEDDDEVLSPKHLSFSIIPMINAVTRIGDLEDRELLMNALIDNKESFTVEKRKKNRKTGKFDKVKVVQDVQTHAIDMMKKIKGKQDRLVKKAVTNLDYVSSPKDNFVFAVLPDEFNKGITGLIANKILGSQRKPVFIVKEYVLDIRDKDVFNYKGSIRFPQSCDDLYNVLNNFDEFSLQGHNLAAGVTINCSKDEALNILRDLLKSLPAPNLKPTFLFLNEIPNSKDCFNISSNMRLFGGSVKEPTIGVYSLKVKKSDIVIKEKFLKVSFKGVELVYFFPTNSLLESINDNFNDYLYFNFYGSLGVSHFLGKSSPQIIMDELVITNVGYENITENSLIADLGF